MQYIVETAQKSLLPAKDIFMQLVSEAIIAKKRKDGDKSWNEKKDWQDLKKRESLKRSERG